MRAFVQRLLLFVVPVAVLLGPVHWVLWKGGETRAIDILEVAREQARAEAPVVFGPAFTNCVKSYKYLATSLRHASVIALGSSRVMQLRADFFPGVSFYNAGGAASKMEHLTAFLEQLPRRAVPRLILLGLDQWFFIEPWRRHHEPPFSPSATTCGNYLDLVQANWMTVYEDWKRGKLRAAKLSPPRGRSVIGLNALLNDNGFRNDGSYRYGQIIRAPHRASEHHDWQFRSTLQMVTYGTNRFAWADELDPSMIEELERFLQVGKRRGVRIVAFLPPYAPRVLDRMRDSGHYGYLEELPGALGAVLSRFQVPLYNYGDMRALGSSDAEFIDGFHGSDRTYLRLLLDLAGREPVVAARVNRAALAQLLDRSTNPLEVALDPWR